MALVRMQLAVLLHLVVLVVGVHGLLLPLVVERQVKVVQVAQVAHLGHLMVLVVAVAQVQLEALVLVLPVAMVARVLQTQLPELLGCLHPLPVVAVEVAN